MSLIAGVASIGFNWFSAGSAGQWYSEVGSLLNNSCDGGILESLENETNKEYPHLKALRQECVDRWRDYQRAMPWGKGAALETYQSTVGAFSDAVAAEERTSYNSLLGGLSGITETLTKAPYLPVVIISVVFLLVIIVLIAKKKKR